MFDYSIVNNSSKIMAVIINSMNGTAGMGRTCTPSCYYTESYFYARCNQE